MTALSLEEKSANVKRVTVYAGYGLFLFNMIAVLMTIAPWLGRAGAAGQAYVQPGRVVFALLGASVIPPLVSFCIGIIASRGVESRLVRRYNGVLFGVLGMWIMLIVNIATSYAEWAFFLQSEPWSYLSWIIPLVLTTALVAGLGVFYKKSSPKGHSVMPYGPFRGMLSGAASAFVLMLGSSSFFGSMYGSDLLMSIMISFILPLSVGGAVLILTYCALSNYQGSKSVRWTYSLVVMGFLLAVMSAATQIASTFTGGGAVYGFAWGAMGLITWGAYIILVHRLLR